MTNQQAFNSFIAGQTPEQIASEFSLPVAIVTTAIRCQADRFNRFVRSRSSDIHLSKCVNFAGFIWNWQQMGYSTPDELWDALPESDKAQISEFVATSKIGPKRLTPPRITTSEVLELSGRISNHVSSLTALPVTESEDARLAVAIVEWLKGLGVQVADQAFPGSG